MATNSKGMSQKKADYGERGESGERFPKGARSSDSQGERKVGVPMADRDRGNNSGQSGEREPPGAKSRDSSGEKSGKINGGVGMGKADATGNAEGSRGRDGMSEYERGEFNTGRTEAEFYDHKRIPHAQDE